MTSPNLPRKIGGITRSQMIILYAVAVLIYMGCTFFSGMMRPVMGPVALRDVFSFGSVPIGWVLLAIYNRAHPDDDVCLKLSDGTVDDEDRTGTSV